MVTYRDYKLGPMMPFLNADKVADFFSWFVDPSKFGSKGRYEDGLAIFTYKAEDGTEVVLTLPEGLVAHYNSRRNKQDLRDRDRANG